MRSISVFLVGLLLSARVGADPMAPPNGSEDRALRDVERTEFARVNLLVAQIAGEEPFRELPLEQADVARLMGRIRVGQKIEPTLGVVLYMIQGPLKGGGTKTGIFLHMGDFHAYQAASGGQFLITNWKDAEQELKRLAAEKIFDQARALVGRPCLPNGGQSPFEMEFEYRFRSLGNGYKLIESDRAKWLALMGDQSFDIVGRMCAAALLTEQSPQARAQVDTWLASKDRRVRNNAAAVVIHGDLVGDAAAWRLKHLIRMASDGSVDGPSSRQLDARDPASLQHEPDRRIHVARPAEGQLVLGSFDDDLWAAPIKHVCWALGDEKSRDAIPALLKLAERRPTTSGLPFAFAEIGDERGGTLLMKWLEDESLADDNVIEALGRLRWGAAVPALLQRLRDPAMPFSEECVLAIRDIGDRSAVDPLRKLLDSAIKPASKAVIRRVLPQLESNDPVKFLIAAYNQHSDQEEKLLTLADLSNFADARSVSHLKSIAHDSPSADLRRAAIHGLIDIDDKEALLALAALLESEYPATLTFAAGAWKQGNPDFESYFTERIERHLRLRTKQGFGRDAVLWRAWIRRNVQ